MNNVVIKVDNISKEYRLGKINSGSLSSDIQSKIFTFLGKDDPNAKIILDNHLGSKFKPERVWALKNINLEVLGGEILGIIGKNGAGKSTLLKILSNITRPSCGEVKIKGKVASLLEVGTGFHPELTGRENIFLNGTILGMKKIDINKRLDQIIEFSGMDMYIDTPIKRYSSGMKVRLGFAVAAHLDSDILFVDEVLAVGDEEFRIKALGKMNELSQSSDKTILFVSHNLKAIQSITSKCILMENGKVVAQDKTKSVVKKYLDSLNNDRDFNSVSNDDSTISTIFENKYIHIDEFLISNFRDEKTDHFFSSEEIFIKIKILIKQNFNGARMVLELLDNYNGVIFASAFYKVFQNINNPPVSKHVKIKIPPNLLNQRKYTIRFGIERPGKNIQIMERKRIRRSINIHFDRNVGEVREKSWPGLIYPLIDWKVK